MNKVVDLAYHQGHPLMHCVLEVHDWTTVVPGSYAPRPNLIN